VIWAGNGVRVNVLWVALRTRSFSNDQAPEMGWLQDMIRVIQVRYNALSKQEFEEYCKLGKIRMP
jgi:hypothetical protein